MIDSIPVDIPTKQSHYLHSRRVQGHSKPGPVADY